MCVCVGGGWAFGMGGDFNKSPKSEWVTPNQRRTHRGKPNLPGGACVQEGPFSSMALDPGPWKKKIPSYDEMSLVL